MFENLEIWWVTGAQLLYGGDAVVKVDAHSKEMVEGLNNSGNIPVKVVYKGTANSSNEVEAVMKAANNDEKCVGIITWMHTFSPAKMWIKGLQALQKPLLHFHTQYNAEIPWETMDMDFMNLNQSAHGDIEFGHICSRMRVPRKVVCGYWKSEEAQKKIAVWARVAAGVADARKVRCLMFGMNMNNVAVTDGDRVEFEQRLGYHVDYYPVSSLMEYFKKVTDAEVEELVEEYKKEYNYTTTHDRIRVWDNFGCHGDIDLSLVRNAEGSFLFAPKNTSYPDEHEEIRLKQIKEMPHEKHLSNPEDNRSSGIMIPPERQGTSYSEREVITFSTPLDVFNFLQSRVFKSSDGITLDITPYGVKANGRAITGAVKVTYIQRQQAIMKATSPATGHTYTFIAYADRNCIVCDDDHTMYFGKK